MTGSNSRDAYLSVPVQARSGVADSYEWLADAVERAGYYVLNPEVPRAVAADLEFGYHATAIQSRNHQLVDAADVFVAEVSIPSHGVGMELARACAREMPVICLWREGSRPLSKMILGIGCAGAQVLEYSSEASAAHLVQSALCALRDGPAASHRSAQELVIRHFDELAPAYDGSAEWRDSEVLLSWFRAHLPSRGLMIDAGSGTGLVAKIAPATLDLVKIDLSAKMLCLGGAGSAVVADLHKLPLRSGIADVITMRQVLHYVDESQCLRELHRILKPGGRLLLGQVTAPDDRGRRWWLELKRAVQPLRKTFHSDAQILELVRCAGFEVTEHTTVDISRHDAWERFVLHVETHRRQFIDAFLAATPSDLGARMRLRLSREGISYMQHWTLVSCEKKGAP
jgi:ubiquinone/menaquinone biosynthesis C-methylase UbiE